MSDCWKHLIISIHAPREGGDQEELERCGFTVLFQSTPPARGATLLCGNSGPENRDFNPRPPRGGRLRENGFFFCALILFQSTPPARGATLDAWYKRCL